MAKKGLDAYYLLFEKKQKGLSFSLAQRKELKETSTLTKTLPIWRGCNWKSRRPTICQSFGMIHKAFVLRMNH